MLLVLLINALLGGLLFFALFPAFTGRAVRSIRTRPLKCLFAGSVSLLVLPAATGLLFASRVGIPLGLIVLLGIVLLVFFSQTFVGLFAGGGVGRSDLRCVKGHRHR